MYWGEILFEEFLRPLEITAYRLSKDTGIPQTRISQIIKGKRRITADTALRLSSYFGTTAKFWLGLQDDYDIEEISMKKTTNNNLTSFEDHLDRQYGKRGTPEREKFEEGFEAFSSG